MKNKLEKKYSPSEIEDKQSQLWSKNKIFDNFSNNKPIFSMILPPPNVTGVLHLGHAWDITIQDTIIRYKKLKGFNTKWIPGTDHAGIATQTKFEKYLKEMNIDKHSLTRKEFINQLIVWKNTHHKTIEQQWKKIGSALNYNEEKFTMESKIQCGVTDAFVKMYNDNLIYQSYKLVNWDIKLQTAISDIEVIHKLTKSKMFHIKYYFENSNDYLVISTTRPETMFGDQALFINPKDKRYLKFLNKKIVNPANNKLMNILTDIYVDLEFGTGVMKCTPAHDFNDYILGKKYNLENIKVFDSSGKMLPISGEFNGLDRLICREQLIKKLTINNNIESIDNNYQNNIGYSERTNEIIEPYLSNQWFIKMKPLVEPIIKLQSDINSKSTIFLTERFNSTLLTWLNKIDDWCISRQLWWGHQLPVWYHKKTKEIYVSNKAPLDKINWKRDEDVLDTWFSSGLWPLFCFNWPQNNNNLSKYYPNTMLVTGYDIIFFWIARMMILCNYFTGKLPFKNVYIHGLIIDQNGIKMSKSLGNGIEPMKVINEYGADSVRLFLLSNSAIGENLRYSEEKIKAGWNFINKLWNVARLIGDNYNLNLKDSFSITNLDEISIWIITKLNKLITLINKYMEIYNFTLVIKELQKFVWNDFCSIYLELIKKDLLNNDSITIKILNYVFKNILILLHPFCPFITEYLFNFNQEKQTFLLLQNWVKIIKIPKENETFNKIILIIKLIWKFRTENTIPNKEIIKINLISTKSQINISDLKSYEKYMINNNIKIKSISDISNSRNCEIHFIDSLKVEIEKNLESNNEKLIKTKILLEKEIARSLSILKNENFIKKASPQKILEEQEKFNKYKNQFSEINKILDNLKN